jgi:serine phosphatase RsbU (regulator of sigma subunit)
MADRPLVVAAASRPYPGETANGDAWAAQWTGDCCRIALVDGLGHGPAAAAAADLALVTLAAQPDSAPLETLAACHGVLAGTRGAAMAVARIDLTTRRLVYAGVGNIEARLLIGAAAQRPISYRGIVGVTLPRVQAFEFALDDDWLLLMHSDGLRGRFTLPQPAELCAADLQVFADTLLRDWARPTDDATVVLARLRLAPCGA